MSTGEGMPAAAGGQSYVTLQHLFEAALSATEHLSDPGVDVMSFVEMHAAATAGMVDSGRFVGLSAAASTAENEQDMPSVEHGLMRRWQANTVAVLAIEQVADRRYPDIVPPLSERLRGRARVMHGDNFDKYQADLSGTIFSGLADNK